MKIYIAARYARRHEMIHEVKTVLEADGHTVTSRWLSEDLTLSAESAQVDVDDVRSSDVLLLITDPTGSKNAGGGRFFEMGLAYCEGIRIVVVGDPEIIFCLLPDVEIYPDLASARARLRRLSVPASRVGRDLCPICGVPPTDRPCGRDGCVPWDGELS